MAESKLRQLKQEHSAAYWRSLTPAQRIKRAAVITAAARKFAAAGQALIDREAAKRKARRK